MPFQVGCGVRQGCPLSTTLFNLFIHDLHEYICRRCPGMGVRAKCTPQGQPGDSNVLVTDLGYADDIGLIGGTPVQLQAIIDSFACYCQEHGLLINPHKCEVMVFSGSTRTWVGHNWHTRTGDQQQELARVTKFKYLGVELHGSKRIKAVVEHRLSRMVAAQSSVNRRLRQLHIAHDPQLVADMFAVITAASGSFGCEVWCTPFLYDWTVGTCKLQRYQATVYKRALGVPSCTSNLLAMFEAGRYPLQVSWLARTARYWNKLAANANNGSLLSKLFRANVHFGLTAEPTVSCCWAREL